MQALFFIAINFYRKNINGIKVVKLIKYLKNVIYFKI